MSFNINNNGFRRAWKKSKESQFYNRSLAVAWIVGLAMGMVLMNWILNTESCNAPHFQDISLSFEWKAIHNCIKCKNELFYNEMMDSNGVCPFCGHKTKGTICDTIKGSVRYKRLYPMWMFWENKWEIERK